MYSNLSLPSEPILSLSFKCAPIVLLDVKRNFPKYISMLRDNRMNLKFEILSRFLPLHASIRYIII